jgi:hypothetical protein
MNGQTFFAALVMLAAFASVGYAQANSRDCPNQVSFGAPPGGPVDRASGARFEVTYFTTDDPDVFISERAGIRRSSSGTVLNTDEFAAKLQGLERSGVARVLSRQSATSPLGEVVALGLERDPVKGDGHVVNAAVSTLGLSRVYLLDRETEISVSLNPKRDRGFYRLNLLSWFVDAAPDKGGWKTVDYDASYLLKPGQTMLLKLISDSEVRRSGPARKYIAVTLRSAGPAGTDSAAGARLKDARAR